MSEVNTDTIKKFLEQNAIEKAIEVPNLDSQDKITKTLAQVIDSFDQNENYTHYIIRVKKNQNPIIVKNEFSNKTNIINENASPEEIFNKAKSLIAQGDTLLARSLLKKNLKQNYLISETLSTIGYTYFKENKINEAISYYEQAIAYKPSIKLYKELIAILIKANQISDAIETLKRALLLDNLNTNEKFNFHNLLGQCYTKIQDYKNAETHYFCAYELNPESDILQVNVGTLALQKKDYQTAEKHFEKALEINLQNEKAFLGLAKIEFEKKNYLKAHNLYFQACSINLNNEEAVINLIKTAYLIKKFDQAEIITRQYLSVTKTKKISLLYSYAGILYHLKRMDDANKVLNIILSIDPNHQGALKLKKECQR